MESVCTGNRTAGSNPALSVSVQGLRQLMIGATATLSRSATYGGACRAQTIRGRHDRAAAQILSAFSDQLQEPTTGSGELSNPPRKGLWTRTPVRAPARQHPESAKTSRTRITRRPLDDRDRVRGPARPPPAAYRASDTGTPPGPTNVSAIGRVINQLRRNAVGTALKEPGRHARYQHKAILEKMLHGIQRRGDATSRDHVRPSALTCGCNCPSLELLCVRSAHARKVGNVSRRR